MQHRLPEALAPKRWVKRWNADLFRQPANAAPVEATEWILAVHESGLATRRPISGTLLVCPIFVLHRRASSGSRIPP
ncbi:hypothetical protein HAX54_047983, partial [Datura stramonium]|nr:hypothetical protein [Datura stramonium]